MRLYHYTKLDNLTSIVQKEKLSFWLTHYKEFDDRSEGEYILKVQQQFYPNWEYNNIERYVLSLSRRYDNLPMWKEYANNATGIALEIETENIKPSIFCRLLPCEYDLNTIKERSEAIKKIKEEYESIDAELKYADYCKRFSYLEPQGYKDFNEKIDVMDASVELIRVKRPCFSYEEEVRLIVNPFNANFHTIVREGKAKTYYEYNIAKNALTKIYVGPNNDESIVVKLNCQLKELGYDNLNIEMVDLPYKSYLFQ